MSEIPDSLAQVGLTSQTSRMLGYMRMDNMPPGWRWVRLVKAGIPGDRRQGIDSIETPDTWIVLHRGLKIGTVAKRADGWHAVNRGNTTVGDQPAPTQRWAVMTLCTELREVVAALAAS